MDETRTVPDAAPRTRRVLVVGIDGVRLDLLAALRTPHLDSVRDAGFLAPVLKIGRAHV